MKSLKLSLPYWSIIVGIVALVWLQSFDQQRRQVERLQLQFETAIQQTEAQMVKWSSEVLIDQGLIDSLDAAMSHTIKSQLLTYLDEFGVAAISILNTNCQAVAVAGTEQIGVCSSKHLGAHWISGRTLNLLQAFSTPSGSRLFLNLVLNLDERWLKSQNALLSAEPTLSFVDGPKKLRSDRGPQVFYQSSPLSFLQTWTASQWPFLMVLIALMVGGVIAWKQALARHQKWQLLWDGTTQSIIEKLKNTGVEFVDGGSLSSAADNFLEGWRMERQACAKKIAELDLALRRSDLQVKTLQQQLEEGVNYESLALQLKAGVRRIKDDLQNIQDTSENIVDTIVHGASRTLQLFCAPIRSWSLEAKAKGSRKLCKTLVETTLQDGRTLFEAQLDEILRYSEQLEDQLLSASSFGQRLQKDCKDADKISTHWFDLSEGGEFSGAGENLIEILVNSQGLVQSASSRQVRFANAFDLGMATQALKTVIVPRPIWLSVIYHLNLALIEATDLNDLELKNALQSGNQQYRLLTSLKCEDQGEQVSRMIRQSKHFQIASKLAKVHKLMVDVLRSSTGSTVAVALMWNGEHAELRPEV